MLRTGLSYKKKIYLCLILTIPIKGIHISSQVLPDDALPNIALEKYTTESVECNTTNALGSLSTIQLYPQTSTLKKPRKKKHHKKTKVKIKPSKKRPRTHLQNKKRGLKDWTVIIYVAADNDLNFFAWKNIKQMEQIGSNSHLNIVIQLSEWGKHKPTQRYVVEKNHLLKCKLGNKKLNSGSPNTLINFCSWAIQTYPAQNYALILWNHGTGAIEPTFVKNVKVSDLFTFNPSNNMLELDRTVGFFDYIDSGEKEILEHRGICFDESHRSYITNQQLDSALNTICNTYLHGKFSLIGFDACLMSMIEIAHIAKKYARVMVGSQEVELGGGWNYSNVLRPFLNHSPSQIELAQHTVRSYQQTYGKLTNDFTQSAIDLDRIHLLEANIERVAQILTECLVIQKDTSIKNVLKMCRSRRLCTSFDEPTYIDLHNFYSNVLKNLSYLQFKDKEQGNLFCQELKQKLSEGIQIIDKAVIANYAGKNLSNAKGLSIYLPEHKMHPSYLSTPFALNNHWGIFLQHYLASS